MHSSPLLRSLVAFTVASALLLPASASRAGAWDGEVSIDDYSSNGSSAWVELGWSHGTYTASRWKVCWKKAGAWVGICNSHSFEVSWPVETFGLSAGINGLECGQEYKFEVNVQSWAGWKQVGVTFHTAQCYDPPDCDDNISWWNGTVIDPAVDHENCRVAAVPTGREGFVYGNSYYVKSTPSTSCPLGHYDGANCYFMSKPTQGFIWNNAFYTRPGPGNSCSVGGFDGANCYIQSAPWGTRAFEWSGNFYTTSRPTCSVGNFDGANCRLGAAPPGTRPFLSGNAFYYEE